MSKHETATIGYSLPETAVILQRAKDHYERGTRLIQPQDELVARRALLRRTKKTLVWLKQIVVKEIKLESQCEKTGIQYYTGNVPS